MVGGSIPPCLILICTSENEFITLLNHIESPLVKKMLELDGKEVDINRNYMTYDIDKEEFEKNHFKIMCPPSYATLYDDKELDPLKKLASVHNSKIRILHIEVEKKLNDIQEQNIKMLDENLVNFEHSFHWMPDYSNIAKEINDFIEEFKIEYSNILLNSKENENFIQNPI